MSGFLCGTLVLALGLVLVLVLDPDDDDDEQPLVVTTAAAANTPAPVVQAQTQKKLKVAKSSKLRPKKTAFKKRSKRFFHLQEGGPPAPVSQRQRRGFTEAPLLALPDHAQRLRSPDVTLARLQPSRRDPLPISADIGLHLIRGPPSPVLS